MKDGLIAFIAKKMRFNHWSPREVAQFLKEVGAEVQVSAKTIYRGIKRGLFDEYADKKPFKRYLRHHGKRRKNKLFKEKRGRFEIDLTIHDRPEECNSRERTGDWEIDTVAGKQGGKCLVTAVDRRSRYLLARLSNSKSSDDVSEALIKMFEGEDVKTVTADQGKEFAKYRDIVNKIGAPIYFADAGKPWQRGTNENTNGLIRDYMPKGQSMDEYSDEFVQWCVNDLNCRPRQCLDYRTPQEVYNSEREV